MIEFPGFPLKGVTKTMDRDDRSSGINFGKNSKVTIAGDAVSGDKNIGVTGNNTDRGEIKVVV